jgi:HPt (histidine-containing phosphotransfer) domain-containing protein
VDGDRALLKEIVELFLEDAPGQLADIRTALVRADGAALERAAHTLKGAVGNFGARAAAEAVLELELMGRARDFSRAQATLAELEKQIRLLLPALAALIKDQAA